MVQAPDARGEFQDVGPLTHSTRLALINQNYQATYEADPTPSLSLQVSGHWFSGAPTAAEKLDVGRNDYTLVRSLGVDGYGFGAEGRWSSSPWLNLTFGLDMVAEHHLVQTFDQQLSLDVLLPDGSVLRSAGTLVPGPGHGARRVFENEGAFLQGLLTFSQDWSAVVGARVDRHNVYGVNPSARAGLVYAPAARPLSVKILYGSSFKAPSAVQLYTQPINVRDLQGNPALRPQTAQTFELAGGWGLGERGELSLNAFVTTVNGRVEFVQKGLYLQAQNIGAEWVVGGELDCRFMIARPLHLRISAGVARTVARDTAVLLGAAQSENPLFPAVQLHALADYAVPVGGLRASVEVSYIGPRGASQSNTLLKGEPYDLPAYVYAAASLSTSARKLFGERTTRAALRVNNVFNQSWTEPGFGGIDVPSQGLTVMLTVVQSL